MSGVIVEVCVATIESIVAAKKGGAQRIELCADLDHDGITPSYGMMTTARRLGPERMHVLIRPRGGDFVYNEDEIQCMISDIKAARDAGADGVVIGALTTEGKIDIPTCQRLVAAARGLSVTFHRAFDHCSQPFDALEDIICLGCDRILTSGQSATALDGRETIKQLIDKADGRIVIMPGAGVNDGNAARILQYTGAREIHGTLRSMTAHGLETDKDIVNKVLSSVISN